MKKKLKIYFICIFKIITSSSVFGMAKVVPIYQGASTLLGQKTCQLSEAADSPQKLEKLVRDFQQSCIEKENIPAIRLETNGRQYQCQNPVQSSASLYVAHYFPFLEKVQTNGLKTFGFTGEIANEKKCPYVSFSKSVNTAVKYSFGVTDPNWAYFNEELPYYENNVPSITTIGSMMVALPSKTDMERQKSILHIDVENESLMILGRTKARRLGQKEICVIGGIPQNIATLNIPIAMPDFSGEWSYNGMDNQLRSVNQFGFTQREYKARKRMIENADDSAKSWRTIYEKTCKWHEQSMEYVVKCAIKDYFQGNYKIENFSYNSIFN